MTMHAGNPLETDEIEKSAINSWIRHYDFKSKLSPDCHREEE